ncbi:MAG TPA: TonB family protein, partial [Usitatibacter sp.]
PRRLTMPFNHSRRSWVPAAAVLAWALSSGAFAAGDITPVSRVEPEFPREAIVAGAEKGRVKARMTVDAAGEVTRVEILDATPRRLFERVVIRTLSQWKFSPGSDGRLMEIDIDFHR